MFAFLLLFVWISRFMFRPVVGSAVDRMIANYMRMLFFVILTGFLLVVTKLFEVMGILGAIFLWMAFRQSRDATRPTAWSYLVALVFDVVESPRALWRYVRKLSSTAGRWVRMTHSRIRRLRLSAGTLKTGLVLIVLGISGYIRLYSAVQTPPPKMSDGDTLLAWIKYIDLRILMHDGVYPQGFFFYMATLGKFAVINTLYVLNFTGPLDSVMIVVMMFFAIKALTRSTVGALVAATFYGVLGHYLLFGEWTRQAGSETEEFGFLFVFPTFYFLHRYLKDGRRTDYWVAFAGLCDTGLIHPLSYLLNIMACVGVIVAQATSEFRAVRSRLPQTLAAGAMSGIIALLPYMLAFVYRIQSNQASQAFLQGSVSTSASSSGSYSGPLISLAPPTGIDIVAIVSILFLLGLGARGIIRHKPEVVWLASGLWGFICYFVYEFGAYLSNSLVLSARMTDLWAITEAFVIGMGAAALFDSLKRVRRIDWVEGIGALGFVSAAVIVSPPVPIMPYVVQWNGDVQAYLQIDRQFKDKGYMIVAPGFEYALVLGSGFHMLTRDFVKEFNPTQPPLTLYGQTHVDHNLAPYVFVYYYKHIFEIPPASGIRSDYLVQYSIEHADRQRLNRWIEEYVKAHGRKFKIFYNGRNLKVYEFKV